MVKRYFLIIFLFFGCLLTIHSKIGDPFPILYKTKIFTSHLNILYAFDVSELTDDEIMNILNRKKILTDVRETDFTDEYIYLKPIWKKKIYRYIPPIIPLDQYVNYICKLEINNDILQVENSKGDIYYLEADTGISISKNIVSDNSIMLIIIFSFLILFSLVICVYLLKKKKVKYII